MRAIVWVVAAAGCAAEPVGIPAPATPQVCASTTNGSVPAGAAIDVAATPTGAIALWVPPRGPVMTQRLDADALPIGEPTLAWPGAFDRARAVLVDNRLVIGAIDEAVNLTWVVAGPLGYPPFTELAILGGIVGPSPIVRADGERVAPNVTYGGLFVVGFDATWSPRTAELAVLSGAATEVAAVEVARTAVVVWSTATACHVLHVANAATGTAFVADAPCARPRIAAIGGEVAIVYEGADGGVYARRGAPGIVLGAPAVRLGDGSAPRIVADGGWYWASHAAKDAIVVTALAPDGAVQTVAIDGVAATSGHELAIVGGRPRVFAATSGGGLVTSTLCAE